MFTCWGLKVQAHTHILKDANLQVFWEQPSLVHWWISSKSFVPWTSYFSNWFNMRIPGEFAWSIWSQNPCWKLYLLAQTTILSCGSFLLLVTECRQLRIQQITPSEWVSMQLDWAYCANGLTMSRLKGWTNQNWGTAWVMVKNQTHGERGVSTELAHESHLSYLSLCFVGNRDKQMR